MDKPTEAQKPKEQPKEQQPKEQQQDQINDQQDKKDKERDKKELPKRGKIVKRDINKETPPNWQRRPHVADALPTLGTILNQTNLHLETERLSLNVNDFVFLNPPPKEFDQTELYAVPNSFRIGRILKFVNSLVVVNMFRRPSEVNFKQTDSRELFVTFEISEFKLEQIRGKVIVQNKHDMRSLDNFKSKPSQFWFDKFFDHVSHKLYECVPVSHLKSLSLSGVRELSASCSYVILSTSELEKLCPPQRKRKNAGSDETFEDKETKNTWPYKFYSDSYGLADERVVPPMGTSGTRSGPGSQSSSGNSAAHGSSAHNGSSAHSSSPRIGPDFQLQIDSWKGQPLSYYTKKPDGQCILVDNGAKADTSLPYVAEMPGGYLSRGTESTATLISKPLSGITDFVQKCQVECTPQLECEPFSLQFLTECCSEFTLARGDVTQALIRVSQLTKRSLMIPTLTEQELNQFESALNPFKCNSWHEILHSVEGKPPAELCQYFWTKQQLKLAVPLQRQVLNDLPFELGTDESESDEYCCGICRTNTTFIWYRLPDPLPLTNSKEFENKSVALCARCAKLWYKYMVCWHPYNDVELTDPKTVEYELLEDAKSFKSQEDKRKKRLMSVAERKEAVQQAKLEKKDKKGEDSTKENKARPASKEKSKTKDNNKENSKAKTKEKGKEKAGKDADTSKDADTGTAPGASAVDAAGINPKSDKSKPSKPSNDPFTETEPEKTGGKVMYTLDETGLSQTLTALTHPAETEVTQPQHCCVCGQLDPSMDQTTCWSCGINVHCACYGSSKTSSWLCDCCLSSRTCVSTDPSYKCVFCPQTPFEYSEWLSGMETSHVIDGFKRTLSGFWCHVRCAVFIDSVKFTNPCNLEGIVVKSYKDVYTCSICDKDPNTKEHFRVGVKVKCALCFDYFHVSCGVAKNYRFGFTKNELARPVIVCNKHSDSSIDLWPISFVDQNFDLTVMQLFLRTHKQHLAERWNQEDTALEYSGVFKRVQIPVPDEVKPFEIECGGEIKRHYKQSCVKCSYEKQMIWFHTEMGNLCTFCWNNYFRDNYRAKSAKARKNAVDTIYATL